MMRHDPLEIGALPLVLDVQCAGLVVQAREPLTVSAVHVQAVLAVPPPRTERQVRPVQGLRLVCARHRTYIGTRSSLLVPRSGSVPGRFSTAVLAVTDAHGVMLRRGGGHRRRNDEW